MYIWYKHIYLLILYIYICLDLQKNREEPEQFTKKAMELEFTSWRFLAINRRPICLGLFLSLLKLIEWVHQEFPSSSFPSLACKQASCPVAIHRASPSSFQPNPSSLKPEKLPPRNLLL